MKKTNWNFGIDPCDTRSTNGGWRNPNAINGSEDFVSCNCTFDNNTLCHVTGIVIKSQDLQGSLPKELASLPFLQELNLARNFLSGSIPAELGVLPLVQMILLGNRLTGTIPKEIGNIASLERLVLENNQLSGSLPPQLGSLLNLQRLYLSSNKFTGKIPSTFGKLISLRNLRLSDNQFKGTLPDFIERWTELEYMVLHSSGLVGPIPISISGLTKLKVLMISDMTGPGSQFPPLRNMQELTMLVLRNLNLTGELPSYLGRNTSNLTLLDLSFNQLSGVIPNTYEELGDVKNLYLTGNMLNGSVPRWMLNGRGLIDLTYNNFSEDSITTSCYHNSMNLFASSYTRTNNSMNVFCLKNFRCPTSLDSLYINCGGDEETTVNGLVFQADDYDRKPGYYESTRWFSSNTGIFLEDSRGVPKGTTIWSDSSKVKGVENSKLYAQARLSPISLTYYMLCLSSGNYKVSLHFAEIMFNKSKSYTSLGKRLFDIHIQGVLVLKDFNIAEQAGGVGKVVVKTFPVIVNNGSLEIRLYWAGKGTVATPVKGVYGPLISAIAVDRVKNGTSSSSHSRIWIGIGVGLVVLFLLLIGFSILWFKGLLTSKSRLEREFKKKNFNTTRFSLRQLSAATDNFSEANKIGEGSFGKVYKGILTNGTIIAVKQLAKKSKQGSVEFLNEVGVISALQHPNMVRLHGFCVEGKQLLLVYEFVENNNLARALFGPQETQISLDWPTRQKICLGVARGLAYIQEESRLKILHRDIKASNILLDKDLNAKIADFGLAKLFREDESHITTNPAGTPGYWDPEYAMKGQLSDKSDVYSFGVLALEIVCGKSNSTERLDSTKNLYFVEWARLLWKQNKYENLVDSRLQDYDREEALVMVKVGVLCTSRLPADRPYMSEAVKMLEGEFSEEMDAKLANIANELKEEVEVEAEPLDIMKLMSDVRMELDEHRSEEEIANEMKEEVEVEAEPLDFMKLMSDVRMELDEHRSEEEITEEICGIADDISEISLVGWKFKGKEKAASSSGY
ncbi:hypothetical protein HID58_077715 [Brassica napus]|uniref:non-specific serine/threonine protein kinase n=1 Tax=Brassica napus TaxID=3708 RepID=A0ABQ7YR50_BRANA|nr:hypothetical protein HID58_077715 [Brassica napus]